MRVDPVIISESKTLRLVVNELNRREILATTEDLLPPASPEQDAKIYIDTTNSRLVFYAGSQRFYIPGTSF